MINKARTRPRFCSNIGTSILSGDRMYLFLACAGLGGELAVAPNFAVDHQPSRDITWNGSSCLLKDGQKNDCQTPSYFPLLTNN